MHNVNETCQSIIDTMKRIEENQLQFHEKMMKLLEILEKNTRK